MEKANDMESLVIREKREEGGERKKGGVKKENDSMLTIREGRKERGKRQVKKMD